MMTRTATQMAAVVTGLLMVAIVGIHAHGAANIAAVLAAAAVAAAVVFCSAATLPVILTVVAITIGDPPAAYAAVAGLCAVAYLALRHAANTAGVLSVPTAVAAVGFTFAGLIASAFPLRLPWLPLVAPLAVLAMCVLALQP